jgi:hypothetical protein
LGLVKTFQPRYGRRMPCEPEDVIRAAQTLAWQGEVATTDAIALVLLTSRADVVPPLIRSREKGWLRADKQPDNSTVWSVTTDGERALADV